MITSPGIYELPESVYHADPCPVPSLSHSIARTLMERSPMHAWTNHPRLNPDFTPSTGTKAMDDGSILHALLLGAGSEYVQLGFDDYKTKAAQQARDAVRDAGKIPVLEHKLDALRACAREVTKQINRHPDLAQFFAPGRSEVSIIWQRGKTWCRGLIDRLPDDPSAPIFDLKTTALSAAPHAWERKLIHDYCTQAAFYLGGMKALKLPARPFLFIVAENEAPYGVSVFTPAPSLMDYAERRIARAAAIWERCMDRNDWPGYPLMTAHVEAPDWLMAQEIDTIVERKPLGFTTEEDEAFLEEFVS